VGITIKGVSAVGLFSALINNASSYPAEKAQKEYQKLLANGENVEVAYKLVRDILLFTPKRLILVDIQGMTGKKTEIMSVPYRSIQRFSVETAGHFDLDAELKIWVSGQHEPIQKTFSSAVNIYDVQAVIAEAVAGAG
jgi:hypothetical protein